jgi:hypothetical protein
MTTTKCPYHGDPVFSDPDSLLVKKTKDRLGIISYVHYDNVGATGLNEHVNNPALAENIRKWYAARGLGVRLVRKRAAGCPYYAVYVGKPLRGVKK